MNTININYAFNGFLYAPLFLADELGFFPKCAKLVDNRGDSECLDRLCEVNGKPDDDWFAICDPFSVPDLEAKVNDAGDRISVVGCMINKLPFWLYNSSPHTRKVTSEDKLVGARPHINKIICYKENTTGYLIGTRLKKLFDISDTNLIAREFGHEFETTTPADTADAVLTSDILRVVHFKEDPGNFIFNYSAFGPEELSPFLFTGILTLRKRVVEDNVWAVLAVLAGLKRAIELLQETVVRDECVEILTNRFEGHMVDMGVTDRGKQESLIREAIVYAFQSMNLANHELRPKKEAWDRANTQWESTFGPRDLSAVINNDQLPSLLLRKKWRSDPEFRSYVNAGFPNIKEVIRSSATRWYHTAALIVALPITLLAFMALLDSICDMSQSFRDNVPYIVFGGLSLVAMGVSVWKMYEDLFRLKGDHFNRLVGIATASGLGTLLSALQLIK